MRSAGISHGSSSPTFTKRAWRKWGTSSAEQTVHQRQRLRVGGLDRAGRALDPEHHVALGCHGQAGVGRVLQPARHVAEAVLVRDELDVARRAVLVELLDLRGGHRARLPPHHLVPGIREGVLRVELEVVDLPLRQPIDDREQRLERRHLVSGDVEHHAADRKVGPVAHLTHRELARRTGERAV